jgi:hypothetical protein
MKLDWLVGISMLAGTCTEAQECRLVVDVRDTGGQVEKDARGEVLMAAETLATKMFRGIDVDIRFRSASGRPKPVANSCGAPILVSINSGAGHSPVSKGAMAYAMPFAASGTVIHVFMDRVAGSNGVALTTILLAHVMVHEITHVIEKTGEHSPDGVMKAHWERADVEQMKCAPLQFAEKDVEQIHIALARYSTAALTE